MVVRSEKSPTGVQELDMLANIPLMMEMTRAIVEASTVPVTVKTRLGWDDSNKILWMWPNSFRTRESVH